MALLDRLRQELNLAGKSAQRALDDGRLRLDLYRARQTVDKLAQRFGYAVFRARASGSDLLPDEYASNVSNLTAAEADVQRIEALIADAARQRRDSPPVERDVPSTD